MTTNQKSVLEFLNTSPSFQFIIPNYQRNYSWQKQQALTLLSDLKRIIENPDKDQFFGNIICESDYDKAIIIDGQQRITTILLMITVICHLVSRDKKRSSQPLANIQNFLIRTHSKDIQEIRLKLKTNSQDEGVFKQIYEENVSLENQRTILYEVYSSLLGEIEKSQIDDLFQFIKALDHMIVAVIDLSPTDDSPQMIFESINSKGVELKPSDKIRNYSLFVKDEAVRNYIYENYWQKIEGQLINISKKRDDMDDFFKNLVIKYFGEDITHNDLYEKFKGFFDKQVGVGESSERRKLNKYYESVMKDLNRYLFLKYLNNNGEYGKAITSQNDRISFMGINATIPFMMAVLEKHEKEELQSQQVQSIFELLETLCVRRFICRKSPNELYKGLFSLNKKINDKLKDNHSKSYIGVFKEEALRLIPNANDIDYGVKNIDHKAKPNILKLILSSYDDKQSKEADLLKQLASGEQSISIEHVMPRKLSSDWVKDLGRNYEQIQEQYLEKLANLTLTGYNSEYGNKSFSEKQSMDGGFRDSPLYINSWIKRWDIWNESTLKKREKWWVKQISRIWAYPD